MHAPADLWLSLPGASPKSSHIVFLAGDEEYRSEEGLPQLARILSKRFGFRCTVLFSVNDRGEVDPDCQTNQPGLESLDKADLCIMLLRFRHWPDDQMRHFDQYVRSGKPIIALRTSTHAFDYSKAPDSAFARYGWQSKEWPGGFGRQILGETWISHWGQHGSQATRGIPESPVSSLLNQAGEVFGTTDVYEAHPPADARILLRGQVLSGMTATDAPAMGAKRTSSGAEQELNDPMMPIAWLRENTPQGPKWVLTCTMGAATDLTNAGLRRFLVNGVFAALKKPLPKAVNVDLVGAYNPSPFGFGGYKKGIKPSGT